MIPCFFIYFFLFSFPLLYQLFLWQSQEKATLYASLHNNGGGDGDFKNRHLISFPVRARDYVPPITPRDQAVPAPFSHSMHHVPIKTFKAHRPAVVDPTDSINLNSHLHTLLSRDWAGQTII